MAPQRQVDRRGRRSEALALCRAANDLYGLEEIVSADRDFDALDGLVRLNLHGSQRSRRGAAPGGAR